MKNILEFEIRQIIELADHIDDLEQMQEMVFALKSALDTAKILRDKMEHEAWMAERK